MTDSLRVAAEERRNALAKAEQSHLAQCSMCNGDWNDGPCIVGTALRDGRVFAELVITTLNEAERETVWTGPAMTRLDREVPTDRVLVPDPLGEHAN